ncbi:E3 ubiquitin-protein ligase rnf8 [Dermatophagoides farinae]|uniref:E3 ubiquitin-protein ligase CHFR n=1 Tax=Dermatophagoides farinae TaxID=6954 RepID=A0A922L0E3_DERFA|nr:E3 ubiquitin-protein ligase rnf8 [Dermatophagoides farinae]
MSDNNVKSDLNNDNIASFKKKNVPVASLIRIITKPDHNCFNEMILTKSPMTIGRNPESDFHITSIEISRVHARIFNLGSSWYLENLSSTNGVYVDGQKVAWRVRLSDNCFVTFGPLKSSSFRYVFVENYKVSMNIQRNVTLSKTIQRSFVLGGTSSGAGAGAVTATGGDITHLSTKPGEDVLRRDFDRKHFEQTMTINLMKIESNFSKLKKDVENQKQELDSIHAKAEMAQKELIRIAEKMKGQDALKNVLLNEISCSVCCDIMHEPTVLNCEHTFCFTCINAWSRRGKQHCPVCRKKFSRMTKSIRFHSLINLILDHYLSEDEKKERKESIESRLTDPAFTNEHSNDESSSQGNLDEILSGSDSSFRDAFSTLLNFLNFHREYNVDSYVQFRDAVQVIADEDEVNGNDGENDDENDVSLDLVESMSPSSNSVHAPTSSSSPVSISSNFPDQLRLRRFSNLISRANESMLIDFHENFGSLSNNMFNSTTTTTDNDSNDDDDSNDPHNGDDDADAAGISDIHAEEDEDDVMEVNTDQSVIFLDDVDDDHDDDNDVDAAADQGSSQVRIANGGSSRRLAAGNGVRNLNRNRRPVGIGHNVSNRWNVRPMRNNNRQSLVQQRLHRIRNSPYPSRNGQSNEPLA